MNIHEIINRLNATKSNTGWQAKCPAHEDKNPSLSISLGNDQRILLHCHAGCKVDDICDRLQIKPADLFPPKEGRKSTIVATYDYTDTSGNLLFQAVRFDPKDFRQRHPDPTAPGGWSWKLNGVQRVIFRLPAVIEAIQKGETIFIAEGEKDVLALVEWGFCATCNPMGAGKWDDSYSESLRGADVVIIPDKDEPGRKHGQLVASKLQGIAKRVRVVELPDVEGNPVKDAHDYFRLGGQPAELWDIVEGSADWQPITEAPPEDPRIAVLKGRQFNPDAKPPEVSPVYLVGDVVLSTPGNITAITAAAKAGKSAFIGAMIAATFKVGKTADTFGVVSFNPQNKALLHFDTEQSIEDHWNLVDRAKRRSMNPTFPDWLLSYHLAGMNAREAWGIVQFSMEHSAKVFGGIHSVLIDGLADLVIDVNDQKETNPFVAELHNLAIKYACPIIGVIHFNPGSEKTRGHLGSQLERKAETNLTLEKDGEVTTVYSIRQRRAPILKGKGPNFKWSVEDQMHMSCQNGEDKRRQAEIDKALRERDDVYGNNQAGRYLELVNWYQNATNKSESTAKREIGKWIDLEIITRNVLNQYEKTTNAS